MSLVLLPGSNDEGDVTLAIDLVLVVPMVVADEIDEGGVLRQFASKVSGAFVSEFLQVFERGHCRGKLPFEAVLIVGKFR